MTSDSPETRKQVAAVFNENLVEQAARLDVHARPAESPGQWRDRVRKAAILAALTPTNPPREQVEAAMFAMLNELHANVPEADRPMALCDLSDEQAQRAEKAVKAVFAALRSSREQVPDYDDEISDEQFAAIQRLAKSREQVAAVEAAFNATWTLPCDIGDVPVFIKELRKRGFTLTPAPAPNDGGLVELRQAREFIKGNFAMGVPDSRTNAGKVIDSIDAALAQLSAAPSSGEVEQVHGLERPPTPVEQDLLNQIEVLSKDGAQWATNNFTLQAEVDRLREAMEGLLSWADNVIRAHGFAEQKAVARARQALSPPAQEEQSS